MKNIFNSKSNRTGDNKTNDSSKKNQDQNSEQVTSSIPSTQAAFYYHPPSEPTTTDSYSHTANSTAGYSQRSAYPSLTNYVQDREKRVKKKKTISIYVMIELEIL